MAGTDMAMWRELTRTTTEPTPYQAVLLDIPNTDEHSPVSL